MRNITGTGSTKLVWDSIITPCSKSHLHFHLALYYLSILVPFSYKHIYTCKYTLLQSGTYNIQHTTNHKQLFNEIDTLAYPKLKPLSQLWLNITSDICDHQPQPGFFSRFQSRFPKITLDNLSHTLLCY